MSLEDMHKTHEDLGMKGVWVQRGMLVGKWARQRIHILVLVGMLLLIGAVFLTPILWGVRATSNEQFTAAGDWSTYGYDNARDNFNTAETIITPATAPQLKQKWAHAGNNGISDQLAAVTGTVYWGSWDGYVHATNISNNARVWSLFIGQTTASTCNPPRVGVASSPTVVSVNGQLEVLVGGGNASFYALNASTGSILWHTSLGSPPGTFIWDSPAVFNGSVYIGTSSFGDCPLVQSKVYQLDAATGAIQNTFNIVPGVGCLGGGVWGSPTIDESAGHIFFATGNGSSSCSSSQATYTFALVELQTSDLSVVDSFQLPSNQRPGDSDFGSTPTLFTTSTGTPMVGVANKNGKYYAFNRSSIGAGPVWTDQVAVGGDCPQCGSGSISPSAWDGHNLYIGGGTTTISGGSCKGSVRKVNPDTGSYIWQHCMGAGPVLGSVTATASGVVAASQGNTVIVMDASSGSTVARLHDSLAGSKLYGGPSISNGVLFVGNIDGNIYAYSPNGQ
jgi:outer membrane protein assembly factor BamB